MSTSVLCVYCGSTHASDGDIAEEHLRCTVCGQQSTVISDAPPEPLHHGSIPNKIGRYEILALLGKGNFASVYRAFDPRLRREVALKVPHSHVLQSPEFRQRMLREPQAASQLQHPNIVPVFDAGDEGELLFLVTGFVSGKSLEQALKDGRFTPERVAEVVASLADALQHAHRTGIVHRDIKPANVMLDGEGEPKLMDFGIAHLSDASIQLTQAGAIMGSPAYMPPEQARGETDSVGPLSDQYSLGVTLYEMLTGHVPFATIQQLHFEFTSPYESPVLERLPNEAPPALASVCRKAMSKRPQDRFTSCAAMADALREFLAFGRSHYGDRSREEIQIRKTESDHGRDSQGTLQPMSNRAEPDSVHATPPPIPIRQLDGVVTNSIGMELR